MKYLILVLIAIILVSGCVGNNNTTDVSGVDTVNEPNTIGDTKPETLDVSTINEPIPNITAANLTINKIQIQAANLYPTRVTVENVGNFLLKPRFDVYVYKNDEEVCSGSPFFDPAMEGIKPNSNETGEITILGCMFGKDGEYLLRVDLLNEDFDLLDSKNKTFKIDYWSKFGFDY